MKAKSGPQIDLTDARLKMKKSGKIIEFFVLSKAKEIGKCSDN